MKLGVLVAVVVAVFVPVAAEASRSTAHVTVTTLSPFTVHGTGFRSRERVRVTVAARTTQWKRVTATRRGRFTTTFTRVTLGHCEMYTVRATGSRGSTAILRVIPECAPTEQSGEPDLLLPRDSVLER
jgi:hypothetical protein